MAATGGGVVRVRIGTSITVAIVLHAETGVYDGPDRSTQRTPRADLGVMWTATLLGGTPTLPSTGVPGEGQIRRATHSCADPKSSGACISKVSTSASGEQFFVCRKNCILSLHWRDEHPNVVPDLIRLANRIETQQCPDANELEKHAIVLVVEVIILTRLPFLPGGRKRGSAAFAETALNTTVRSSQILRLADWPSTTTRNW